MKPGSVQDAREYHEEFMARQFAKLRYDYSLVPSEHRRTVQEATLEIGRRQGHIGDQMIAIGERLLAAKELLPPGQFAAWWKSEFEYETRMVQQMMNVARRFGGANARERAHLSDSSMRLLAAPSVPDEVVTGVLELNEARLKDDMPPLVMREVKQLIQAAMTPPNPRRVAGLAVASTQSTSTVQVAPQLTDSQADSTPYINAQYSVAELEPSPGPMSFDAWLAAMPSDLDLRQCLAILTLAQATARHVRSLVPDLHHLVSNVLPAWAQLVHGVEKAVKR